MHSGVLEPYAGACMHHAPLQLSARTVKVICGAATFDRLSADDVPYGCQELSKDARRYRRTTPTVDHLDVAWHLMRRLGLLAVALGSGAVQVLAEPHPGALAAGQPPAAAPQQPASGAGGAPAVVELRPVAVAAPGSLGASLPSTVEWLPTEPHDRLLVRAWPGLSWEQGRHVGSRGPQPGQLGRVNAHAAAWHAVLHELERACQLKEHARQARAPRVCCLACWMAAPGPPLPNAGQPTPAGPVFAGTLVRRCLACVNR